MIVIALSQYFGKRLRVVRIGFINVEPILQDRTDARRQSGFQVLFQIIGADIDDVAGELRLRFGAHKVHRWRKRERPCVEERATWTGDGLCDGVEFPRRLGTHPARHQQSEQLPDPSDLETRGEIANGVPSRRNTARDQQAGKLRSQLVTGPVNGVGAELIGEVDEVFVFGNMVEDGRDVTRDSRVELVFLFQSSDFQWCQLVHQRVDDHVVGGWSHPLNCPQLDRAVEIAQLVVGQWLDEHRKEQEGSSSATRPVPAVQQVTDLELDVVRTERGGGEQHDGSVTGIQPCPDLVLPGIAHFQALAIELDVELFTLESLVERKQQLERIGVVTGAVADENARLHHVEAERGYSTAIMRTGLRNFVAGLVGVLLSAVAIHGQAPPTEFEVASVRLSGPPPPGARAGRGGLVANAPNRVIYERATFLQLMVDAYGVLRTEIKGGPAWATANAVDTAILFDITATIPPGATKEQVATMLRNLLKERFALAVHRETVDTPGFALVVAKGGPKIKASAGPVQSSERNQTVSGPVNLRTQKDGFPELSPDRNMGGVFRDATARLRFRDYPPSDLAQQLTFALDIPVADRTGLTGNYDFTLEFTVPENGSAVGSRVTLPLSPGRPVPLNRNGPSPGQVDSVPIVSSAMEKQLGMKLEAAKVGTESLVIDHVEMPTAN